MCDLEESATQNQERVDRSFWSFFSLVYLITAVYFFIFSTASIPDLFHLFSEIQVMAHIHGEFRCGGTTNALHQK